MLGRTTLKFLKSISSLGIREEDRNLNALPK